MTTDPVSIHKFSGLYNQLINSEAVDLDYKEVFKFNDKRSKLELIKDIHAFANTKGGYIIYGVTKRYEWIGLDERSDEHLDDTQIQQLIDKYILGDIQVVFNELVFEGKDFILFYVYPSIDILTFKIQGTYERKGRKNNSKTFQEIVFNKDDVYCRRGSRSMKADAVFYKRKKFSFNIIENITSINPRYSKFIGRTNDLDNLHNRVTHPNTTLIQVDGIGGIGKTTLVYEYCTRLIDAKHDKYVSEFDFVIWMSAKRTAFTSRGIREINKFLTNYQDVINEIVNFLELSSPDETEDEYPDEEIVVEFLANNKVLLVIDNMETLMDDDLIKFLEDLPRRSKAILTTRESISDFQMARVPLVGFSKGEFIEYMSSEYTRLTNRTMPDYVRESIPEFYRLTKGMPLAGTLIINQLSENVDISVMLRGLDNGTTYEELLKFCFEGELNRLDENTIKVLYVFSLCEIEQFLSITDLEYVTGIDKDTLGMQSIPKLTKYSLCISKVNEESTPVYSAPHLTKIYASSANVKDKKTIIDRFEKFNAEQNLIEDTSLTDEKFYQKVHAKNHHEKLAARRVKDILDIHFADGYETALSLLSTEIDKCPDFGYLWYLRGRILDLSKTGSSYTKSRDAYLRAVKLNPELIDGWIELGFLDLRMKTSNRQRRKELHNNQEIYFNNALKLNSDNKRACLGLGITLANKARYMNITHEKQNKIKLARRADELFDKSYYENKKLVPIQRRMNAITAHNQATNLQRNLRDNEKALRICNAGLEYSSGDRKLIQLRKQLMSKLNPEEYKSEAINLFKKKGWMKD